MGDSFIWENHGEIRWTVVRKGTETMNDIDFVIAWVDGGDPAWRAEKKVCAQKLGLTNKNDDVDGREERYRDWNNLRYWFRGVERFSPWVRTIHFVTWGHLPPWINTKHPKLHIVNHADYLPQMFRPTFNANTIELNFHRINGLSEHFVYFNDDVFLINAVQPEDFFRHGRPCDMLALQPDVANPDNVVMPYILLNDAMVLAKYFDKRTNVRSQPGAYFHIGYPPRYFFYNLLEMSFPKFTGFFTVHGPSPLKKSTYNTLWQKESELLTKTCLHPFRHRDDVNQYLIREWQKLSGEFEPVNLLHMFRYFNIKNENHALLSCIRKQSAKCICVNDSDKKINFESVKAELNQALEQILPLKSEFEL